MKRTFDSRFINVGRIQGPDLAGPKHPTFGRAYQDPGRISRELRGIPESWTCPDCGTILAIEAGGSRSHIVRHPQTKYHQRALTAARATPTLSRDPGDPRRNGGQG